MRVVVARLDGDAAIDLLVLWCRHRAMKRKVPLIAQAAQERLDHMAAHHDVAADRRLSTRRPVRRRAGHVFGRDGAAGGVRLIDRLRGAPVANLERSRADGDGERIGVGRLWHPADATSAGLEEEKRTPAGGV